MFYLFGSLLFALAGLAALVSMAHDVARYRHAMMAALLGLSDDRPRMRAAQGTISPRPASPALARAVAA